MHECDEKKIGRSNAFGGRQNDMHLRTNEYRDDVMVLDKPYGYQLVTDMVKRYTHEDLSAVWICQFNDGDARVHGHQ